MFEEKYYLAAICLYHEILIRSSVTIKKKVLLITEFASISGHRETHTQRGLLIEQVVFFLDSVGNTELILYICLSLCYHWPLCYMYPSGKQVCESVGGPLSKKFGDSLVCSTWSVKGGQIN